VDLGNSLQVVGNTSDDFLKVAHVEQE
jgi:hypothetical protein